VAEIRRVQQLLREEPAARGVRVLPLHGNLAPAQQDEAIRCAARRGAARQGAAPLTPTRILCRTAPRLLAHRSDLAAAAAASAKLRPSLGSRAAP
jgi:hypothetical protein